MIWHYLKTICIKCQNLFSPLKHLLWVSILRHFEIFFFFSRKYHLTLHANCLHCMKCQSLFSPLTRTLWVPTKHVFMENWWPLSQNYHQILLPNFNEYLITILGWLFIFLHKKNVFCGYSLEAPHQVASNVCFDGELEKTFPELSSNSPP